MEKENSSDKLLSIHLFFRFNLLYFHGDWNIRTKKGILEPIDLIAVVQVGQTFSVQFSVPVRNLKVWVLGIIFHGTHTIFDTHFSLLKWIEMVASTTTLKSVGVESPTAPILKGTLLKVPCNFKTTGCSHKNMEERVAWRRQLFLKEGKLLLADMKLILKAAKLFKPKNCF